MEELLSVILGTTMILGIVLLSKYNQSRLKRKCKHNSSCNCGGVSETHKPISKESFLKAINKFEKDKDFEATKEDLQAARLKESELPDPNNSKRCSCCGNVKPFDFFYRDKKAADGHQSWCKYCKSRKKKKLC